MCKLGCEVWSVLSVDTSAVPRCEDEFTKVAIRFMRVNKGRRNKDHGCVAVLAVRVQSLAKWWYTYNTKTIIVNST